jgi:hypothetical protein
VNALFFLACLPLLMNMAKTISAPKNVIQRWCRFTNECFFVFCFKFPLAFDLSRLHCTIRETPPQALNVRRATPLSRSALKFRDLGNSFGKLIHTIMAAQSAYQMRLFLVTRRVRSDSRMVQLSSYLNSEPTPQRRQAIRTSEWRSLSFPVSASTVTALPSLFSRLSITLNGFFADLFLDTRFLLPAVHVFAESSNISCGLEL